MANSRLPRGDGIRRARNPDEPNPVWGLRVKGHEQVEMNEQIPVATWVRVSDDKSDVRAQRRKIREHVQSHRYHVAAEFDLPPVSGSKGHPEHEAALARVTEMMRGGEIKLLVIFHSSRLDRRDELEQAQFTLDIWKAGGEIDSIEEGESFGRRSRMSRAMSVLRQGENADYSVNLSAMVRKTNDDNDANGAFRGRAPIGWMVVCGTCGTVCRGAVRCTHRGTKKLVPDPVTAPVVAEIDRKIAASQPVPMVVAWLWEVHRIKRTNASLCQIVRAEKYKTGVIRWKDHAGRLQTHVTRAIVSADLWQAANANLQARPSTNPHHFRPPKKPDYSGSLFCGTCHAQVYRCYSGDEPKRVRYYRCIPCKWSAVADTADARVEKLMAGDTAPELEIRWMEGSDHSAEAERVQAELDDLPKRRLDRKAETELRERLWARLDELEAMPKVAPRRELTGTGRTWGVAWQSWTWAEKVSHLRGGGFQVRLSIGTRVTALGKVVKDSKNVTAKRVWLVQQVDVGPNAPDLGNGVRAQIVMGSLPILWSDGGS